MTLENYFLHKKNRTDNERELIVTLNSTMNKEFKAEKDLKGDVLEDINN